jgi:hypothetical protein
MPGSPEPRVSWFSSSDYGRDKPGALWLALTERALTFRLGLRQPYLVSTWRSVSATVIVTSGELP